MGSAIAAAAGMVEREWASIKQLPGRQQQRIADRWLEDIKRKHPDLVMGPQSKEYAADCTILLPRSRLGSTVKLLLQLQF